MRLKEPRNMNFICPVNEPEKTNSKKDNVLKMYLCIMMQIYNKNLFKFKAIRLSQKIEFDIKGSKNLSLFRSI